MIGLIHAMEQVEGPVREVPLLLERHENHP
jgi:hypothetical protein